MIPSLEEFKKINMGGYEQFVNAGTSPRERWYILSQQNAIGASTYQPAALSVMYMFPWVSPFTGYMTKMTLEITTRVANTGLRLGFYDYNSERDRGHFFGQLQYDVFFDTETVAVVTTATRFYVEKGQQFIVAYNNGKHGGGANPSAPSTFRAIVPQGQEYHFGSTSAGVPITGFSVASTYNDNNMPSVIPQGLSPMTSTNRILIAVLYDYSSYNKS